MHGANLDNVSCLFALKDAVSSTSRHAGNVEKLSSIDHVIVYNVSVGTTFLQEKFPLTLAARNANALGLYLEAKTAFVFPESGGHTRLHSWRSNLTSVVKGLCLVALRAW